MKAYRIRAEMTVGHYGRLSHGRRQRFLDSIGRLPTLGRRVKPYGKWRSERRAFVELGNEGDSPKSAAEKAAEIIKLRAQQDAEIARPEDLRVAILSIKPLN